MAIITVYKILPNGVFGGPVDLEVADVNTSPIPADCTRQSPYPIPDGSYAVMDSGWQYVMGSPPPWPLPTPPEEIQAQNKATASGFLSATDWTTIPDVANPEMSNPYLMNQGEFIAWRSQVRAIAVNPPTTPAVFPTQPVATWSE
jgi:hypothetical protein